MSTCLFRMLSIALTLGVATAAEDLQLADACLRKKSTEIFSVPFEGCSYPEIRKALLERVRSLGKEPEIIKWLQAVASGRSDCRVLRDAVDVDERGYTRTFEIRCAEPGDRAAASFSFFLNFDTRHELQSVTWAKLIGFD